MKFNADPRGEPQRGVESGWDGQDQLRVAQAERETLANCAMNLIFMINHFKLLYAHFKS